METLPPEYLTCWGRPVPVSVIDQYAAAALQAVIASPSMMEECHTTAVLDKKPIHAVIGRTALSLGLAAVKARIDLWPEPVKKP